VQAVKVLTGIRKQKRNDSILIPVDLEIIETLFEGIIGRILIVAK